MEQAKAICRLVGTGEADAISCSQSGPATFHNTFPSYDVPDGEFVELANEIREGCGHPVATVGRINSPQLAEEVILSRQGRHLAGHGPGIRETGPALKLQSGDARNPYSPASDAARDVLEAR